MISKKLKEARDFEAAYVPRISEEERPAFHITGGIGWINDPNGFSVYKGEYHLFFQYHPYSNAWGPMHWGHVKTKDFIRWERLPVAMAPDTEADRDGCFSGSAIELPDGRQLLAYTGVNRVRRDDGLVEEYQRQCVAFGDGINYEKYEGNPVITGAHLPEDGSHLDFRDPKIWLEDGTFYLIAGNRTRNGSGAIRLFESPDALNWHYVTTVDACHSEFGKMWECPDFFPLDGKQVLLVSPQEMEPQGLEFHAGYGTVALMGTWDKAARKFDREKVQAIDYGIDFYAPQTLLTPDGRRIMIAWMQNWTTVGCKLPHARFFGQMTLPRELSIRNGRLCQEPVRELANYRGRRVRWENVMVTGNTTLKGVKGRLIDMTVSVRPAGEGMSYGAFQIHLAQDGEHVTTIRYKPMTSVLRVDRTRSGFPYDIVHVRNIPVRFDHGSLKLRIVMDRNTLEIFVNDGEQAASFMLYTPLTSDVISFETIDGAALLDVEKFELVFGTKED